MIPLLYYEFKIIIIQRYIDLQVFNQSYILYYVSHKIFIHLFQCTSFVCQYLFWHYIVYIAKFVIHEYIKVYDMLEHFLSIQLNNGEWYFYKQAKFLVSTFPGKYLCQEYIQELGNLDITCFDSSHGKVKCRKYIKT